jgi:DNA-directed RNA polymerase subunit RPC12/RpoP
MNKQAKTNALVLCADFLRSGLKAVRGHLMESLALVAGGALFFVGLAEIIGAFDPAQSLNIADPIFGVSFRHLMLIAGTVQLAVSFVLLFTNWEILGFGLTAWLAANFLVFRIGLWNAGWHQAAGFMVVPLGFSPHVTDAITSLVSVFLLAGACVVFWMERRATNMARFSKAFCPACGGHVKFPIQNLGQQIACPHCKAVMTLQSPGELMKMTCVLCGGHVEFPVHAAGQKILCPHCAKSITLLKPA